MKTLAPRLRHRVTIENVAFLQDATTGAVQDIWTTFASDVPAEVYPLSGREFVAAQATQAGVTTKITIRHIDGVYPKMRVLHGGIYYNIKAVLPDPTFRRHISLMCEAGVQADIAPEVGITYLDYGSITQPADSGVDYGGV